MDLYGNFFLIKSSGDSQHGLSLNTGVYPELLPEVRTHLQLGGGPVQRRRGICVSTLCVMEGSVTGSWGPLSSAKACKVRHLEEVINRSLLRNHVVKHVFKIAESPGIFNF